MKTAPKTKSESLKLKMRTRFGSPSISATTRLYSLHSIEALENIRYKLKIECHSQWVEKKGKAFLVQMPFLMPETETTKTL